MLINNIINANVSLFVTFSLFTQPITIMVCTLINVTLRIEKDVKNIVFDGRKNIFQFHVNEVPRGIPSEYIILLLE